MSFARGHVGQGWRFLQQMGNTGEKILEQIIRECIKPKASYLRRGKAIGGGSRRRIDFELLNDAGEIIANFEAKSKFPHTGSQALKRLSEQLLDMQKAGRKNVKVISGERISDKHLKNTIDYLSGRGVDVSSLYVFNGFLLRLPSGVLLFMQKNVLRYFRFI